MKKFYVRKALLASSYTISIGKGDVIPDFASKEDGERFVKFLNHLVQDYKNNRVWVSGTPTDPGIYLIETEEGFTVVNVNDGKIETINEKIVTETTRHILLKGATNDV